MRRLTVLLMILGLVLMAVPFAQAAQVPVLPADYIGSRTVGDGHTLGGGVYVGANAFTIRWNIVTGIPGEPGEFEYNYTITGVGGGALSSALKNLFFLVSPNFNVIEPGEVTPNEGPPNFLPNYTIGSTSAGGQTLSNAIYWTTLNDTTLLVHFDALVSPVWGSFYADNGLAPPNYAFARNGDFPSFMDSAGFFSTLDYIPVPDTSTVPVPPAVWLFGSGLLGLVGWRRFKA